MKKIITIIVVLVALFGAVWYIKPFLTKSSDTASSQISGTPYSSDTFGFKVTVPYGFTVDESYLNQDLGPGREIPGVAFKIPEQFSTGTNLATDSHVAVEELSDVACEPSDFLSTDSSGVPVTVGSAQFTYATSSDAGAGNRYDESVYITQKGNKCYAVRYFIHYGNIQNYDPGTVMEFDRESLLKTFEAFPSTLVIY